MADNVYKALARVCGVVLPLGGAAAVIGGAFAHKFVAQQLEAESISMPDAELIEKEVGFGSITEADAKLLRPHAGVTLSSGPQALIYADNYVLAHMKVAAKQAGVDADQATYAGVGDLAQARTRELKDELRQAHPDLGPGEINGLAKAEINDPETDYDTARQVAALQKLRAENFFMGNAIRGMLLNAYGWWLVGLVARMAGHAFVGLGAVLAVIGFWPARKRG